MVTSCGWTLLSIGLIWIATTIVIFVFDNSIGSPWDTLKWFGIPSIIMILTGVILVIIGKSAQKKQQAKSEEILNYGLPARARVTFVDKNWQIMKGPVYIYSIVEYEFSDSHGRLHTCRNAKVDSEQVIRSQIVVGSEVDIKYLRENPLENVLILTDPRENNRQ